ncbi:hypothetical protein V6N13_128428 [Hibiscus sabdariffa]|uniref:Uncharacterized protein n=1 Tax=Hibiscus sabdariffa TaxID=183260 RepID=A0ABR2P119_9ROSI
MMQLLPPLDVESTAAGPKSQSESSAFTCVPLHCGLAVACTGSSATENNSTMISSNTGCLDSEITHPSYDMELFVSMSGDDYRGIWKSKVKKVKMGQMNF